MIYTDKDIELKKTIAEWYKHFGVDHIFFEIDSSKKLAETQRNVSESIESCNEIHFENLEDLKQFVMKTDICGLKKFARNTVFSDGDPKSDIMIIGEAPGESEDIQGKPFVGQSGQLLDNMLRSVGLSRSDTYITNIVFWRPPGNRTPNADEMVRCMPYVEEHIRLINPKVLLLLGGVAVRSILNTSEGITRMRGRKNKYKNIDVIPTFHPAYLLRSPGQKAQSFNDMISLAKLLKA